jgi:hypothetical protein
MQCFKFFVGFLCCQIYFLFALAVYYFVATTIITTLPGGSDW